MEKNLFSSATDIEQDKANISIDLYKRLLKFTENLKKDFLKNSKTFENQLEFSLLNEECYYKLYSEIKDIKSIKPLNNFFSEIRKPNNDY